MFLWVDLQRQSIQKKFVKRSSEGEVDGVCAGAYSHVSRMLSSTIGLSACSIMYRTKWKNRCIPTKNVKSKKKPKLLIHFAHKL